jgi:hypothetical protein
METDVKETAVQDTKVSSVADDIIAIAKKVERECPHYFEQVFKAIVDALYIKVG